jgi:N-carbamoyl-L-amino-acid hydrolase
MTTLKDLNEADRGRFVELMGDLYDHAAWLAERAWQRRPYRTPAHLKHTLAELVRSAESDAQMSLLNTHRDDPAVQGATPAQSARLRQLAADYRARFGWPIVVAPGARGMPLSPPDFVAECERRLDAHAEVERDECLRQLHRIAELRLNQLLGVEPSLGGEVWDWAERLAQHTDPGYAEQGQLTVTYLTDAHRACAQRLSHWMREDCGFDEVGIDAVGNVVGVYHGTDPNAPRLLTGSHYDTVRNGGKYDGRLGILVPMACVRELHRAGRRLPFGLEVIGFAEEEGQRYKATFLGSGALVGQFDEGWLDQADADGITMRQAMQHAGLCIADIPKLARDVSRYLGFVEVHIEQGPVLNEIDLPLGVVTSINGSVRYLGEVRGMASHAGTTPMDRRRDAAAAVAELVLFVEQRAGREPQLVGTVGMLDVPNGSINVVPGRCRFSLDLRATTNPARDALAQDVRAALQGICERRGVSFTLEETLRADAAPSAPAWQQRWERAVEAAGLPVHRMPSGAGHDAMKLHEAMPQAMLFVRGERAGISHNPLESTTSDDMQLAVDAFAHLLGQVAHTQEAITP